MLCKDYTSWKAFLGQTIPWKTGKSQAPGLEKKVASAVWTLMIVTTSLIIHGLKQANQVSDFSWTGQQVSSSHAAGRKAENKQLTDKKAQKNNPNL